MDINNSPPPPYEQTQTPKVPLDVQGSHFPPPPQFSTSPYVYPQMPASVPLPPQNPPIVVHQIISRTPPFGPFPFEMDCPYCYEHIVTHTSRVPGALTWILMAVCFVLGFFLLIPWCLCCLPFCIDPCLDVVHACPKCHRQVGRFSRIWYGNGTTAQKNKVAMYINNL